MPSKRENLEQLLDKNLSKTPDQARRESQSISSILQRFGGPSRESEISLLPANTEDIPIELDKAVSLIGTPIESTPQLDIPNDGIPTTSMPIDSIPNNSMPISTIPIITTPRATLKEEHKKQKGSVPFLVDPARGWLALPNDIVDKVLPKLSLPEQAVLLRMYRLSRGYGSEICTIGYVTLGKLCNISRNTVKTAVKSLIVSGWIECLEQGAGADHSTYRIKLPSAAVSKSGTPKSGRQKINIPDIGMPNSGMAADEMVESNAGMPAIAGIPANGPIKEIESSKETTHTTQSVSVGSHFSLEDCRRYADHLKQTGQGIKNPGGYATKIFRSGEADAFIEAFLNPPAQIDISQCQDCKGTGFIYLDMSNPDRGVKPCNHRTIEQ